MTATASAGESPVVTSDQRLTAEELSRARLFLEQTHTGLVGATRTLTEAQWRFKPAPDQWSVAENLGHIAIVQERVLGPILDSLAEAAPAPEGGDRAAVDAIVMNHFSSRLARFKAPEFLHPVDQIAVKDLLERLGTNYTRLSDALECRTGLREHAGEAAPLKAVSNGVYTVMDGYQWILASASHAERHTKQILEVMAHPDFPL